NFAVTFLGTASGGGPSASRNCSSLVLDILGNGNLWMVDCAEGTTRQFSFQYDIRAPSVKKIFVTHMHADHVMGIIGFLRNILFPKPVLGSGPERALNAEPPYIQPTVEVYGPVGTRAFVRQLFQLTRNESGDRYVVHELLMPLDPVTSCDEDVLHDSEAPGRDIMADDDGFWREIVMESGRHTAISVDVGPIEHRAPCIGYVFRETVGSYRKLVILGDTNDPSAIIPLCLNPSPSLLVHEATDAHIPDSINRKHGRRPPDVVRDRAVARGHSIPAMAGLFARTVGAERLVLNHIGSRFPAPNHYNDNHAAVIREIERQANDAWG
ncbi:hypothetical protein FISHEDRAFT_21430, partial [Fistulina hepatica ATCC 64428]